GARPVRHRRPHAAARDRRVDRSDRRYMHSAGTATRCGRDGSRRDGSGAPTVRTRDYLHEVTGGVEEVGSSTPVVSVDAVRRLPGIGPVFDLLLEDPGIDLVELLLRHQECVVLRRILHIRWRFGEIESDAVREFDGEEVPGGHWIR